MTRIQIDPADHGKSGALKSAIERSQERKVEVSWLALRKLLDEADAALDADTYDQKRRDDLDAPDDAEYSIQMGTVRKVNALISELDRQLSHQKT